MPLLKSYNASRSCGSSPEGRGQSGRDTNQVHPVRRPAVTFGSRSSLMLVVLQASDDCRIKFQAPDEDLCLPERDRRSSP